MGEASLEESDSNEEPASASGIERRMLKLARTQRHPRVLN
jgi:hypothetical protein